MDEQDYWYCALYLPSSARRWLASKLASDTRLLSDIWRDALRNTSVPPSVRQALARAHSPALAAAQREFASERWRLLTIRDQGYPDAWRLLGDAPLSVWVCGHKPLLARAGVAVVGTRRPTLTGRRLASDWSADFAQNGLAVVSGLALGIDAAAHAGALSVSGATVAIMGTGPDRVYPSANQALAAKIADHGLLVSEFPVGRSVAKHNFPQRNRLIAALAVATVVVEAAERSGSLITAHLAAEYGREVFAIPGAVNNPMAAGCHKLIREGAHIATSPDDIYSVLAVHVEMRSKTLESAQPMPSDSLAAELCTLLAGGWCSVDDLCEALSIETEVAARTLLRLELEGYVVAEAGGYRLHPDMRTMAE
ncbi:MAG: DNA-protecting protein DprA [Gammaproteobacteria bacterium]|nr:MAG: DNA-protecting protein DprA [Gammaproteobacteria bacterium]